MIALIGGSGFIGSRLAARLKEKGDDFVILDVEKSSAFPEHWKWCDVRDNRSLLSGLDGCHTIINLAAEHKDNVTPLSLYDEVNVDGARNVALVADELGIKKIIFTSSVAVYGLPKNETDETGEFNHFNDYGRTKLLAEKEYEKWFESSEGKSLLVIRPTVVFGEGNRGNVYNLLAQIVSGRFLMIGNGNNRKSMIYIENVVALLVALIDQKGYMVMNAVDKPDYTMNELVREVNITIGRSEDAGRKVRIPYWIGYLGGMGFDVLAAITGKKLPISSVRVKKFCATTQFKSNNISQLNFTPPVPLKTGLQRTLKAEFLQNHRIVL
ncbi:NAD-dependent epimerase/dehydratase family protein [uncultured Imperialibacter sp.]|uniref:NAD-dependent epimerase/dehydratase family protein n=1 Tax=uncultured Imperialibacter sp. TaxID=1672639 RepID=UPI0030DB0A32|tara:strand:+ start:127764 stop:128738 length:975 start_codon:yes stop_codon:yes gene_type:complete